MPGDQKTVDRSLRERKVILRSEMSTLSPPTGSTPLLRRMDQAAVASLCAAALIGMAVYWLIHGGHRGQLIEIDRADPLTARYLVDLNKADWPEFAELPDVGETLARRIVESRISTGPYGDHDDLLRVPGIGPRTLEKLKPYLLPMPNQDDVAGTINSEPGS